MIQKERKGERKVSGMVSLQGSRDWLMAAVFTPSGSLCGAKMAACSHREYRRPPLPQQAKKHSDLEP